MTRILVVGAGLAGAVHARVLAEAGHRVTVIDRRDHIAGNCFDYNAEEGIRVHRYGPHLFHTSNMRVVEWLSGFTEWLPYEHRVKARLRDDRLVPMPVNRETVGAVYKQDFASGEAMRAFLDAQAVACANPTDAEQYLLSRIGPELTDLFYRSYTRKMWGLDLSDMSADVVRRLQIRDDCEDRYFPTETFQALPVDGYSAMFARILDHHGIEIRLKTGFSDELAQTFGTVFNSMPIDEYFSCDLGDLPYRSIRFHLDRQARSSHRGPVTINYTDTGPCTRETWWHALPGHDRAGSEVVLRTVEEPCDYRENAMERYYPVKTSDGRYDELYRRYAERPRRHADMHFIGRCGTYRYLDMDQVVNQSLANVAKWLQR